MLRFLALLAAMAALPALGSERPAAKPAAAKARVPERGILDTAEKRVREVFGEELSQANSAEQDLALSSKFAKVAAGTNDDPAVRYVLLRLAAQRACSAGKSARPSCWPTGWPSPTTWTSRHRKMAARSSL